LGALLTLARSGLAGLNHSVLEITGTETKVIAPMVTIGLKGIPNMG